jgi:general secretion pathway protein I
VKRGGRGARRAFTIIEVLVALAVFALTAVVLGGAYLNVLIGYQIAGRDRSDEQQLAFARQQLMQIPDLETAKQGDKFATPDGRQVSWTAAVDPTDTADLFTVTLTCEVGGTGSAPPRTFVQGFMLMRPTWSDPTDRSTLRANAATRIKKLQQALKGS